MLPIILINSFHVDINFLSNISCNNTISEQIKSYLSTTMNAVHNNDLIPRSVLIIWVL